MPSAIKFDYAALEQIELDQIADSAFSKLSDRFVPGRGADNPRPRVFIIGEAPGAQEETQLRPFVGPSGVVLADLMAIAGLYADDQWSHGSEKFPETTGVVPANAWLTNVVKFRPPGNRKPTDAEIHAARPYLMREWVAVGAPSIIIPVGACALRTVVNRKLSILKTAGRCETRVSSITGRHMHIWPMVHPAFALRNEAARPLLERDWERLGEWFATYSG